MKFVVLTVLALAAVINARNINLEDVIDLEEKSVFNYINKVGVPLAEEIRKAEEEASNDPSRIVGGSIASLGQFPYQAGLLMTRPGGGPASVGGGSLVSRRRVLTAAHNLNDGVSQATSVTVVLGSVTIFSGGTRLVSAAFFLHPQYNARLVRNDIAMINLPRDVATSNHLAPIALPSGSMLNEGFVGSIAIASGFGKTRDDAIIPNNQRLSFVNLPVLANSQCQTHFPNNFLSSNICTGGSGGRNFCTGDSGGPLAINRNNRRILIGVLSFGSSRGCQAGFPSASVRVTSYMSWINSRM